MHSSELIQLSALEESEIAAIIAQLPWRECQAIQKKYLKTGDSDPIIIGRKLARDMNFTLQTKIQLHYDVF